MPSYNLATPLPTGTWQISNGFAVGSGGGATTTHTITQEQIINALTQEQWAAQVAAHHHENQVNPPHTIPPQPLQFNPAQAITNPFSDSEEETIMSHKSMELFYNRKLTSVVPMRMGKQEGRIGLEIECEGTKLFNDPFVHWTCHSDGSLREVSPGNPAVEYVLKKPLNVPELEKALAYLERKLKEAGSDISMSPRTSVHVHVNCQDMTVRQLYCYVLLYMIFEEVLVDWSGPDRAGNLFCLRAKDSDYYVGMLESALKQSTLKPWTEHVRYAACNVSAIPKFGSLEFRSLRGTVDMGLIITWVRMLLLLRDQSLKYSNPVEIADEFVKIGPLPFFKKIFNQPDLRALLESIVGLSGKLWDGQRLMRDIAYVVEWTPSAQKKKGQQEEFDAVDIIRAGQTYLHPDSGDPYLVHYKTSGNWRVVDSINEDPDQHYQFTVLPGMVMYFISLVPGYGSTFIILDVRPLPVDYVEADLNEIQEPEPSDFEHHPEDDDEPTYNEDDETEEEGNN